MLFCFRVLDASRATAGNTLRTSHSKSGVILVPTMIGRHRRRTRCSPRWLLLWTCLALSAAAGNAQRTQTEREAWNKPMEPFRIIGNIYYVGPIGVSSFLIHSDHGDILLDGALPESAHLIEKNVAALGFHMKDVRILLNSHAHFDHAGGLAELKRASGARFEASAGDKPALESGRAVNGTSDFPPVKVDRVVTDGDTVKLGDVTLTAHLTPGHTPGCTSWSMTTSDAGKPYRVVFDCSTTVGGNQLVHNRKYPGIVSGYEASFRKLGDMPCDVFLAPHGGFFDLENRRESQINGNEDAFVDSTALRKNIDQSQKDFEAELRKQQDAAKPPVTKRIARTKH